MFVLSLPMPRVGLLQITKLLMWLTLGLTLLLAHGYLRDFLFFILGFYRFHLTTAFSAWRVTLLPGLSRSFQTPSTTAVSYVRVFPLGRRHNLICRSRLSLLSSLLRWGCSLILLFTAGAGSPTLQGVKPGHSYIV
jgi:hypothetical protein